MYQGKGIADQDRNILSNQTLILGFLRSAAGYLVTGPVPQAMRSSKRKKKVSSDDEDMEDEDRDESDDEDTAAPEVTRTRGTILITLRNVSPYTEWSVLLVQLFLHLRL